MSHDSAGWREKLSSRDVEIRREAARQLATLGPEARDAAVALARACRDDDEGVRDWASGALEELGPPNLQDLSALAALTADPTADTAYWAATLLGRLEHKASSAAPALIDALQRRKEPAVRQRIVWALGQLGSPVAAMCLKQLADDPTDERLARLASSALQQLNTW